MIQRRVMLFEEFVNENKLDDFWSKKDNQGKTMYFVTTDGDVQDYAETPESDRDPRFVKEFGLPPDWNENQFYVIAKQTFDDYNNDGYWEPMTDTVFLMDKDTAIENAKKMAKDEKGIYFDNPDINK